MEIFSLEDLDKKIASVNKYLATINNIPTLQPALIEDRGYSRGLLFALESVRPFFVRHTPTGPDDHDTLD